LKILPVVIKAKGKEAVGKTNQCNYLKGRSTDRFFIDRDLDQVFNLGIFLIIPAFGIAEWPQQEPIVVLPGIS
jgi:hypothetical protein